MNTKQTGTKTLIIISFTVILFCLYLAIGFFFDLFIECIPLLLLIIIIAPLIAKKKKKICKGAAIAISIIFIIISASLLTAVVSIVNTKPDNHKKIMSGSEQKFSYSKSFMKSNYDINQKALINVWLPESYSKDKKYPVIYVLDGDKLFHSAAVYASERSTAGEGDIIVVGIGYGYWNSTFARGGIILGPQNRNARGRWRDFVFADDKQQGSKYSRGEEYISFLKNTVVKDIRTKYSTDPTNSTIIGHSLGGGLAAYLFTQYNPILGEENAFTNFIIADNAFTEYYNHHFIKWKENMEAFGNSAYSTINIYRIWGGSVNPDENPEQFKLYTVINDLNFTNVNNFFYIPEGANHSDTQTIGIYNAINLALGLDFDYQTQLESIE